MVAKGTSGRSLRAGLYDNKPKINQYGHKYGILRRVTMKNVIKMSIFFQDKLSDKLTLMIPRKVKTALVHAAYQLL